MPSPHLYVDNADIARIKANLQTYPWYAAAYENIHNECETMLRRGFSVPCELGYVFYNSCKRDNQILIFDPYDPKNHVCPKCGNILCAAAQAEVYCCGKKLESLPLQKADEQQKLCVEQVETEYFISGAHEMTKQHHIAFVALLSGDTVVLKKQYPEWDLQVRMPRIPHGKLVWYCTQHGLYYQLI